MGPQISPWGGCCAGLGAIMAGLLGLLNGTAGRPWPEFVIIGTPAFSRSSSQLEPSRVFLGDRVTKREYRKSVRAGSVVWACVHICICGLARHRDLCDQLLEQQGALLNTCAGPRVTEDLSRVSGELSWASCVSFGIAISRPVWGFQYCAALPCPSFFVSHVSRFAHLLSARDHYADPDVRSGRRALPLRERRHPGVRQRTCPRIQVELGDLRLRDVFFHP